MTNPKTLMGRLKVPMLSVLPSTSLIAEAAALQYGAFDAPKKDGTKGYGPYNWRDEPIEAMVYVDACARHLATWTDGEECATDSLLPHLWHAKATLGILIDAIENGTWIDDRPKVKSGAASRMLERIKGIIGARNAQEPSPQVELPLPKPSVDVLTAEAERMRTLANFGRGGEHRVEYQKLVDGLNDLGRFSQGHGVGPGY